MQMTRVTPRRLITLQCSQIGFTLERTFTGVTPKSVSKCIEPVNLETRATICKMPGYGVTRTSLNRHPPSNSLNPRYTVSFRSSAVPSTI